MWQTWRLCKTCKEGLKWLSSPGVDGQTPLLPVCCCCCCCWENLCRCHLILVTAAIQVELLLLVSRLCCRAGRVVGTAVGLQLSNSRGGLTQAVDQAGECWRSQPSLWNCKKNSLTQAALHVGSTSRAQGRLGMVLVKASLAVVKSDIQVSRYGLRNLQFDKQA